MPGQPEWLSRDPIGEGGGINLYQFVGNVPINRVDELGLCWEVRFKKALEAISQAEEMFSTAEPGSWMQMYAEEIWKSAVKNYRELAIIASGGAGVLAQASAVATSSVGYVFSAEGVAAFGATAVTAAGASVVATAVAFGAAGYGISRIPIGGGRNVSDALGDAFYNMFY